MSPWSDVLFKLSVIRSDIYKPRQIEKKRLSTPSRQNWLEVRNESWDAPSHPGLVLRPGQRLGHSPQDTGPGLQETVPTWPHPHPPHSGDDRNPRCGLRGAAAQSGVCPVGGVERSPASVLTKLYERFVSDNGPLNGRANTIALSGNDTTPGDPDLPFLLALENYDAENDTATPGDLFTSGSSARCSCRTRLTRPTKLCWSAWPNGAALTGR